MIETVHEYLVAAVEKHVRGETNRLRWSRAGLGGGRRGNNHFEDHTAAAEQERGETRRRPAVHVYGRDVKRRTR